MANDGKPGLDWDWPGSVWQWNPESGPWQPGLGAPAGVARLAVSTAAVAPGEAYDFWRSMVFYNFSAERADDEQRRHFHAAGTAFVGSKASIGISETDRLLGSRHRTQRQADGMDDITIGFVTAGHRWQVDRDGDEHRADAGQFYVYDAAMPAEVGWGRGGGVYLALSRELALGADGAGLGANAIARRLATSPLAPFLAAQFAQLWKTGQSLSETQAARLLPSLTALAQAVLAPNPDAKGDTVDRGRLAAAMRFIHDHLGEDLSPERIAAAVNCSRATLYRLFAERELTVAGYVRERRLLAAMSVLRRDRGASITAIAARFGFNDASTFSHAFRRRFGVSPRDVVR